MKKNVASQVVCAQLVATADGSAVTTGTTTVYVLGDGGTQGSGSGIVTHEGNGCWSYAPTQAETNYDHIAFTFTNSSAVSVTINVYTTYPQTGDNYARLGAPAGASVSADIAALPTAAENRAEMDSNSTQLAAIVADTNELQTNQGDWATATGFSTLDAAGVRNAVGLASANLDTQLSTIDGVVDDLKSGIIYGTAQTGTLSVTQASTNLTGYADDQLIGRHITWLSGSCEGEQTDITDYANTSGVLTFTSLTTAPANGDTFKIT